MFWWWILAPGKRNFSPASIRRPTRSWLAGRLPRKFMFARFMWWPRLLRMWRWWRERALFARQGRRELADSAELRRLPAGILRRMAGSRWGMGRLRWERKGLVGTACAFLVRGRGR